MDEDTKLMMRVKKGQEEAFMLLFDKYAPQMLTFFRRNGFSRQQAEDLTQEVFLKVWKERKRFLPFGSFRAWVYRIATNLLINEKKKNRRESMVSEPPESLSHAPADQHAKAEMSELINRAEEALAALPLQWRTALLLSAQGLSYSEAAKAMNVSVSAYKTLLFRGRKRMKELIYGGKSEV